jgi:hypothetical protein
MPLCWREEVNLSTEGENDEKLRELRARIHQHVIFLTASGETPERALAIAAHSAVLCDSALCDEAIMKAKVKLRID